MKLLLKWMTKFFRYVIFDEKLKVVKLLISVNSIVFLNFPQFNTSISPNQFAIDCIIGPVEDKVDLFNAYHEYQIEYREPS